MLFNAIGEIDNLLASDDTRFVKVYLSTRMIVVMAVMILVVAMIMMMMITTMMIMTKNNAMS